MGHSVIPTAQPHQVAGGKTQRWDRLAQATGLQRGQALWREPGRASQKCCALFSETKWLPREKAMGTGSRGAPDEAHTGVGRGRGGGPQCGLLMQQHRAGVTAWRLWEWRGKASRHIWLESQRRAGGLPGLSLEEGFSQEARTLLKAGSDPVTSFNPQGKEEHAPPPGMASSDPGHTQVHEGKGKPKAAEGDLVPPATGPTVHFPAIPPRHTSPAGAQLDLSPHCCSPTWVHT